MSDLSDSPDTSVATQEAPSTYRCDRTIHTAESWARLHNIDMDNSLENKPSWDQVVYVPTGQTYRQALGEERWKQVEDHLYSSRGFQSLPHYAQVAAFKDIGRAIPIRKPAPELVEWWSETFLSDALSLDEARRNRMPSDALYRREWRIFSCSPIL